LGVVKLNEAYPSARISFCWPVIAYIGLMLGIGLAYPVLCRLASPQLVGRFRCRLRRGTA